MEIYLDNAATTRVCALSAQAATAAMTSEYGNPSSTHKKGRQAASLVKRGRAQIAKALNCSPDEIYFTASGTESDNWAIFGSAAVSARVGKHIISSKAEHPAVLKSLSELDRRGFEVTLVSPEPDGSVSAKSVLDALRPDTVLVSLMLVSNETGGVTDIAGIKKTLLENKSKALLHTDAVQAFLKVPTDVKALGCDLLSISGHKVHAPKGIGALFVRRGLRIAPYIFGGGQENGMRGGTESVPLIAAFGEAVHDSLENCPDSPAMLRELKDYLTTRLSVLIPEAHILKSDAPHIISISLPGYRSEVLMNFLEARDIFVSRSSACKKGGRSHVLEAIGLPSSVIDGTLRLGLSRYTTKNELDIFCDMLGEAKKTLVHR